MFDATNRHGLNSWYFNVLPCHQACNKLLQSGKSASRSFETVTTDTGAIRLWGVSKGMFGGQTYQQMQPHRANTLISVNISGL